MSDFASGPVPALALSPDGRRVAAAAGQDHVALTALPPSPSAPLSHVALPRAPSLHAAPSVTALSFPSVSTLYTADARGALRRLAVDPAPAEVYSLPAAHGGAELTAVAALSDASAVATSGKDATVRVWDPETRQSVAKLVGHKYEVRDVAVASSADAAGPVTLVASAGRDKTVRLWDVRASAARPLHVFRGHAGWVHSVALAARPTPTLLSCAGDKTVRVWDLVALRERAVLKGHEYRVWGVAVAPDGAFAVSGSTDATLRAWNLAEGSVGQAHVFEGHRDSVLSVDVARDGSFAVSGCEDGSLYLWDCATLFGRQASRKMEPEVLLDVGDDNSRSPEKASVVSEAAVPKQLDPVPLVVEKADPAPSPTVETASQTNGAQRSTDQSPAKATPEAVSDASNMESVKAAVSVSVEQLPKYDKSAAELVNALTRIKELEKALEDVSEQLASKNTEVTALRRTVGQKDAEIALLQKQVDSSKNLVNAANVRALLAANPRKADVSLDYEEPVNKIGAVSDQLTALAARLDAMILTG